LYSRSVINSFVEFSVGSVCYTDDEMIKLQERGKNYGRWGKEDGGKEDGGKEDGPIKW
jgi:hypothetical protein